MNTVEPDDLPGALKEIVAALLDGDWTRYADEDGHFYYVVRQSDYWLELNEGRHFGRMLTFAKTAPDAFEDWYVRAALAEEPADRLKQARMRVKKAGIDPKFFDDVVRAANAASSVGELRGVLDAWMPRFVRADTLDPLSAVLEAIRIERVRKREIFVSEADRPAIHASLRARLLKELAERYPKAVERASRFDWLSISDPQLREACRCYVYGFFRAAIMLAATAVESRLRALLPDPKADVLYSQLVHQAFGKHGVLGSDPARAAALVDLFTVRNEVAHEQHDPSREAAERIVILARGTMDTMATRVDARSDPQ